jgi:hypothetical protein
VRSVCLCVFQLAIYSGDVDMQVGWNVDLTMDLHMNVDLSVDVNVGMNGDPSADGDVDVDVGSDVHPGIVTLLVYAGELSRSWPYWNLPSPT